APAPRARLALRERMGRGPLLAEPGLLLVGDAGHRGADPLGAALGLHEPREPGRARPALGALRDPGGERAAPRAAGSARAGARRAPQDGGAPRARTRRLRPRRRRPLRERAAPGLARPLALARAEPPGGARGAPGARARRGTGEPDRSRAPD